MINFLKGSDAPGGDVDIAAAVAINPHIAEEMAKFDIRP